ncbi:MAG: DUF3160 domain-containing protein, partial [Eudoraea sp.]|nr:DUF3160 domain-containing protein [Eudoraea sp.]
ELIHQLKEISKAMMEDFLEKYRTTSGVLKEAAKRNIAFFAVGLKLQDPKAHVPSVVATDVKREIQNIESHRGFSMSTIFKYREDFSQYVPRGHYSGNEDSRNYFKTMMWYGRMSFLLKSGLVSKGDARIQTLQACLIATSIDRVRVKGKTAAELWDRVYSVTSFFVGLADDLTLYEYKDSMRKLWGDSFHIDALTDEEKLLNLKAELAKLRRPKIYGGTGQCLIVQPITPEKANQCLHETQGMHFMSQRFIPDSYVFQNLVNLIYKGNDSPFTMVKSGGASIRGFPRGLDLIALLGSKRAMEIIEQEGDTDYEGYDEQFSSLKAEFTALDESKWNRNLYWGWLFCLKALLKAGGHGYPSFMQTNAWQDKQLQTALASWAQLRHDTILYAKPSYTVGAAMPPKVEPTRGYVEPVAQFYTRLLALTNIMDNGLTSMNVLDRAGKLRLQGLKKILTRLIQISKDELEDTTLNDNDYEFIRSFGDVLKSAVSGISREGRRTSIIADVHTDLNSSKVLEEGVGYVNLILAAYGLPDGRILVGMGPVFSYYEFKWAMMDRLTDEKWKEMLKSGKAPDMPSWATGFTD